MVTVTSLLGISAGLIFGFSSIVILLTPKPTNTPRNKPTTSHSLELNLIRLASMLPPYNPHNSNYEIITYIISFSAANGVRYPLVGGTREHHFDGINFKPRKLPENAPTPTSRVHAVLDGFVWVKSYDLPVCQRQIRQRYLHHY